MSSIIIGELELVYFSYLFVKMRVWNNLVFNSDFGVDGIVNESDSLLMEMRNFIVL